MVSAYRGQWAELRELHELLDKREAELREGLEHVEALRGRVADVETRLSALEERAHLGEEYNSSN